LFSNNSITKLETTKAAAGSKKKLKSVASCQGLTSGGPQGVFFGDHKQTCFFLMLVCFLYLFDDDCCKIFTLNPVYVVNTNSCGATDIHTLNLSYLTNKNKVLF